MTCFKNKGRSRLLATCEAVILIIRFLLEWSFRSCPPLAGLCGSKLLGLCPDTLLIVHPVLTVNCICLCLGWVLNIRLIQQFLDSQKNLFNSDGGPPVLVFFQDGEAHSSRWVDIWVENWGLKLAFWWWRWVVIFEQHSEFVKSALPQGSFLSWDGTFPIHEVHCPIWVLGRHSNKTKRVVFPPGFTLLGQSAQSDARHDCSLTPPSYTVQSDALIANILEITLFASLRLTQLLLVANKITHPSTSENKTGYIS